MKIIANFDDSIILGGLFLLKITTVIQTNNDPFKWVVI